MTLNSTARRYLDGHGFGAVDALHEADPSAYYAGSQRLRQIIDIEEAATVYVLKGGEWPAHRDLDVYSLAVSLKCDAVRPGSSALSEFYEKWTGIPEGVAGLTAADPSTSSAILSPPKSDEQPGIESVRRRIVEASENSEIVTALRLRRDLRAFAEEVDQLIRRLADEPDEPQPDTGSLKLLARAALADNRLRTLYCLALDGEGHVHAEWHFSRAKLFMTFRPTGHAKIVVVHPGGVGEAPLRVAGSLYSPRIESFTKWLVSSLP